MVQKRDVTKKRDAGEWREVFCDVYFGTYDLGSDHNFETLAAEVVADEQVRLLACIVEDLGKHNPLFALQQKVVARVIERAMEECN